jgi:GMP synthase PP-ATPase subunit
MKVVTEDRNIFQPPIKSLVALQEEVLRENRPFTRALYAIQEKTVRKPYVVALRAVQTRDFLSAGVSEVPWSTLNAAAEKILAACSNVSNVYYDVTPKPPATIEME